MNWKLCVDGPECRALDLCRGSMDEGDGCGNGCGNGAGCGLGYGTVNGDGYSTTVWK